MSAAVQEDTHRQYGVCTYCASSCSKRWTFGPVPIHPERRESTTSAISESPIVGRPKIKKLSRIDAQALAAVWAAGLARLCRSR